MRQTIPMNTVRRTELLGTLADYLLDGWRWRREGSRTLPSSSWFGRLFLSILRVFLRLSILMRFLAPASLFVLRI